MTEFPELQAALVEAAGRRHGRRWNWRPVGRFVLVGAAVAAAIALFVVVGRPATDVEQPVTPAKPRVTLRQHFEVFRRPRTAADRLPSTSAAGALEVQPGRARLVAKHGDYEVFLVPVRGGEVCMADFNRGLSEGEICSTAAEMADETNPVGQFGPDWVVYALPDGVHDVRVVLADGTPVRPRLRDNAFLIPVVQAPYSVTWVGASGELHGIVLNRIAVGTPGCDSLDPLPRNAEGLATNAATLAARVLYPGASDVRVSSVAPAQAPDCGRAVLRVALSTGEDVWVGSAHARMVVWPVRTAAG